MTFKHCIIYFIESIKHQSFVNIDVKMVAEMVAVKIGLVGSPLKFSKK